MTRGGAISKVGVEVLSLVIATSRRAQDRIVNTQLLAGYGEFGLIVGPWLNRTEVKDRREIPQTTEVQFIARGSRNDADLARLPIAA